MKKTGNKYVYLKGLLISVIMLPLFSLLAAFIAYSGEDPTGVIGTYSLIALLLSAAVSGFITSKMKGEGGWRTVLLTALTVVLIMLIAAVIITGGTPEISALMNYLCYIGISVLSGYLALPRKKHRRRK